MLSDVASERAVLAGLFKYGEEAYLEVSDILTPETFTHQSNVMIYSCIEHLFKEERVKNVDFPSILSAAKDLGISEFVNKNEEVDHITSIMRFPVDKANIRSFAGKIRKLTVGRQLYDQLELTQKKYTEITGNESIAKILGIAEESIFDFMFNLFDNDDSPQKLFENAKERVDYLASNPVDQVGIPTGFPYYDKAIGGGLRPGTVNVIGARPKTGKTICAENMGINIAKQGIPVLDLDTEMRLADHQDRGLANIANVDMNDIETGQFAKNAVNKNNIYKALEENKDIPYFHKNISGLSFEQQLGMMRRWIAKEVGINPKTGKANKCVIIYDYLKLMDSEGMSSENLSEFQMLGFMMTGLHNFSIKYDIPFLTFIQLNRDGITKEGSDAASGSDRIIWLCSNFTIFKTKSDEEMADDGLENGAKKFVPVLARHGEGLKDGEYINIVFKGRNAKMIEKKTNLSVQPMLEEEDNSVEDDEDVPF